MPPGYATVGDIFSSGADAPSALAVAVALNSGFAAYPVGFRRVWPPPPGMSVREWLGGAPVETRPSDRGSERPETPDLAHVQEGEVRPPPGEDAQDAPQLTLWLPEAPDGFVTLGCVATTDGMPPLETSVACVMASAVEPGAAIRVLHCGALSPATGAADGSDAAESLTVWGVGPDASTFLVGEAVRGAPGAPASGTVPGLPPAAVRIATRRGVSPADLWARLRATESTGLVPAGTWGRVCSSSRSGARRPDAGGNGGPTTWDAARVYLFLSDAAARAARERAWRAKGKPDSKRDIRLFARTSEFRRVFWEQRPSDFPPGIAASLWRPVLPQGFAAVGDCISFKRREPPLDAMVFNVAQLGGLVAAPAGGSPSGRRG